MIERYKTKLNNVQTTIVSKAKQFPSSFYKITTNEGGDLVLFMPYESIPMRDLQLLTGLIDQYKLIMEKNPNGVITLRHIKR